MADQLTGEVTELLQQLIRNQCVNDGTPESGEEVRNADLLRDYLEGTGLDIGFVRARCPAGARSSPASRAATRTRRRCA